MEEDVYVDDLEESDEDKIDCMSPWELGFEEGVTKAEEESFEDWHTE